MSTPTDHVPATFPRVDPEALKDVLRQIYLFFPGGEAAVDTWDDQGWAAIVSTGDPQMELITDFLNAYPAINFPLIGAEEEHEIAELRVVPWFVAQLVDYLRPTAETSWYLDLGLTPPWHTFPTNAQIADHVTRLWGGRWFDVPPAAYDAATATSLTRIVNATGWDQLAPLGEYMTRATGWPARAQALHNYATALHTANQ